MTVPAGAGAFDIAVIGLSGRWPGAADPEAFWRLLTSGTNAIRLVPEAEMAARGVDRSRLSAPDFVRAVSALDDIRRFAGEFFGYPPHEAALLDPQQRIFLECAWEALEDAGYAPRHVGGSVGVFASCSLSTYLLFNVLGNDAIDERDQAMEAMIGVDKDFLATRVSYKLNLTGPSLTAQTGCSSSLVAVSLAVQHLLTYQCDVALAGGVSVGVPQRHGYFHQPFGILSEDGCCRPFSAKANGTVFGDGAGVVVLKRLADALDSRDYIYAVIRSAVVNNDGSGKLGYTAPSVAGQADVVRRAHALAGVAPSTIGYVEAHGTATALGDSVEVAALGQAFAGAPAQSCAIGSVKGNIGHLDAAAGITGLIKAVLMLERGTLAPSLHCEAVNPQLELETSPFYVNTVTRPWQGPATRRAGVSSFGIGGTNAHVVLEEAPAPVRERPRRTVHVVPLSADDGETLDRAADRLRRHLGAHPEQSLADVAYTCQVGRETFRHRRVILASDASPAESLGSAGSVELAAEVCAGAPRIVFMFPGGASQYAGMGRDLYNVEPRFREAIDTCAEAVNRSIGVDLRTAMFAPPDGGGDLLDDVGIALPAIFTLSYALVDLFGSWGIRPAAMIGHSLGEYVAACVAGVMSLPDALALVALRGALFRSLPAGAMVSVAVGEAALAAYRLQDVSIAAVNGPDTCVISGAVDAIARATELLDRHAVEHHRLHIQAAAHSPAVEPMLATLRERLQRVSLQPPRVPFVSNLTGRFILDEEATDPEYWIRHLRHTVRFGPGIQQLVGARTAFVEVGPGRTLTSLVKPRGTRDSTIVVPTMRHPREDRSEESVLYKAVGRLWLTGVDVDWQEFNRHHAARRIPLPTYPFPREDYWIEPPAPREPRGAESLPGLYRAEWLEAPMPASAITAVDVSAGWLICADGFGIGDALRERLEACGARAIVARPAAEYRRVDQHEVELPPDSIDAFAQVVRELAGEPRRVNVVHLWSLSAPDDHGDTAAWTEALRLGAQTLVACAQAALRASSACDVLVVSDRLHRAADGDRIAPEKRSLDSASVVVPQEIEIVRCRLVDMLIEPAAASDAQSIADTILAEWNGTEPLVAYRHGTRRRRHFARIELSAGADRPWLVDEGVYLVTGGTGQLGLRLARWLADLGRCRIVLTQGPRASRTHRRWRDATAANDRERDTFGAIAAAGSQVRVYSTDVSDPRELGALVREIESGWGPIRGVFHLAGTTGEQALAPVTDLDHDIWINQFRGKGSGAAALRAIADSRPPEFVVAFSSTSSVLGGPGMLPYAAANAFLDGLASTPARDTRWISVNWDAWLSSDTPSSVRGSAALKRHAIPEAQALVMLDRILTSGVSGQVVVSKRDFNARVTEWTERRRPSAPAVVGAPRRQPSMGDVATASALERQIADTWADVLGVERVGLDDNFFELGGNSLLALRLIKALNKAVALAIGPTTLFKAPTVRALARACESAAAVPSDAAAARAPASTPPAAAAPKPPEVTSGRETIAIVGMSGRFPSAASVDELWSRLAGGEELIRGAGQAEEVGGRRHVSAVAMPSDYEWFDAEFFGMSPAEAMLRDPQHRLLLEHAWTAFEHAGYDCRQETRRVGVFAGATTNTYLTRNIATRPDLMDSFGPVQINVANGADFLTTLVSYKMNFTGPSHSVNSACSTSLVCVHAACRSLLSGECDMAIAGGVSVNLMLAEGYRYVDGGIMSPDGRCRPFDAQGNGTVFGGGVGVVVLKRLSDAIADGDTIHAVVLGSAVNNDGHSKAGYTAPGFDGQVEVVRRALDDAGVTADTIGYVEAHGTATALGDPIEVQALTEAYRRDTGRTNYCAIGSVKSNVGHLDAAAGITGLIKTVECLKHETLVPTLHFERSNPEIDFENSPFYVNTSTSEWKSDGQARRAGISGFGVGGTNAHVIVEQAPQRSPSGPSRDWHLLVWSGRTAAAASAIRSRLATHLAGCRGVPLADVAFTLQQGRAAFAWRAAVICRSADEAVELLQRPHLSARNSQQADAGADVVFAFAHERECRWDASRELYEAEPEYRAHLDDCVAIAAEELGMDVHDLMCVSARQPELHGQAAVRAFTHEYALARMWESWGVRASGATGLGIGRYVARCIDGGLELREALRLAAGQPLGSDRTDSLDGGGTTGSSDALVLELGGATCCCVRPDAQDGAIVVDPVAPNGSAIPAVLGVLARLWTYGHVVDWNRFWSHQRRHRVVLPTYPFERARHWIDEAGSVDRRHRREASPAAAPVTFAGRPTLRNRYVPPRDDVERAVVDVVERALGIRPVGVTDPFGELGGDSLQAIQIIEAVNARIGASLQVVDLYDTSTIRELVQRYAAAEAPAGEAPLI